MIASSIAKTVAFNVLGPCYPASRNFDRTILALASWDTIEMRVIAAWTESNASVLQSIISPLSLSYSNGNVDFVFFVPSRWHCFCCSRHLPWFPQYEIDRCAILALFLQEHCRLRLHGAVPVPSSAASKMAAGRFLPGGPRAVAQHYPTVTLRRRLHDGFSLGESPHELFIRLRSIGHLKLLFTYDAIFSSL
jgi:hypothetical protein